jgi:GYF domain 2
MSSRSWFYASQGQQQGPYPEIQLRDLIVRGTVGADTLVWSEGMSGWQKAGEIPGLMPGVGGPPAVPGGRGPLATTQGNQGQGYQDYRGGPLSADLPLWELLGRALLFMIGFLLVIPAPWVATSFYRWGTSRLRVPGRPDLAFTGQVGDIWYVFIAMALLTYTGASGVGYLQYLAIPVQAVLSWMTVRWIAANFSSQGRQLPVAFDGSALTYIGWYVLLYLSAITIIGWAWVITAWMRWICRNVSGTQREIIFNASGLDVLWRTLLFVVGCGLLIPIPWALRWYGQWYASQFALVERTA